MAEVSYVIDDASLIDYIKEFEAGNKTKEEINEYLQNLELVLRKITDSEYGNVYIPDTIHSEVIRGKKLFQLLSVPPAGKRDIYLRFQVLINRIQLFIAEDHLDLEVYESDEEFVSSSFIQNKVCGFISSRKVDNESWWNPNEHTYIESASDTLTCYRKYNYHFKQTFFDISKDASKLWPNCYFHSSARRFSQFQISEILFLPKALSHLDYLNDFSQEHFTLGSDEFKQVSHEFGVTLSPESSKTRNSPSKMNFRKVEINGETVTCEWHTKLDCTKGRIHFHVGHNISQVINNETRSRVIIGKFVKHLPT